MSFYNSWANWNIFHTWWPLIIWLTLFLCIFLIIFIVIVIRSWCNSLFLNWFRTTKLSNNRLCFINIIKYFRFFISIEILINKYRILMLTYLIKTLIIGILIIYYNWWLWILLLILLLNIIKIIIIISWSSWLCLSILFFIWL